MTAAQRKTLNKKNSQEAVKVEPFDSVALDKFVALRSRGHHVWNRNRICYTQKQTKKLLKNSCFLMMMMGTMMGCICVCDLN